MRGFKMRPLKIFKEHRYFESQEKGEHVILITRKHWLPLISPFLLGLLTTVVLIFFFGEAIDVGDRIFGGIDPAIVSAFNVLLIMYVVLSAFGAWLVRYFNSIILTNKHMVDVSQGAFFARSVSTLALENIEDVSINKTGFLATILDYGNLRIQTAGELPNFEIRQVADPETIQKKIMEAKENLEESQKPEKGFLPEDVSGTTLGT